MHVRVEEDVAGLAGPAVDLAVGGDVPFGEVFDAGAQDGADLVQRVVGHAAVAAGVLLDAAADFVNSLGGELDHVESAEDGGGVGELVVDGVLVHGAGSSRDQIEEPRSGVSIRVTGQIDS